ncbi:MAG: nuclear transport factor 2 family protein [Gammaproteobacteria bacterium]|nr:nuclear transport factor 2 family protein [Gammaproteobacteria bacterium]
MRRARRPPVTSRNEFRTADEARGIWAMYHFYLDKQDMQQLEMFAYYDDIYRRMDGRWLIARTSYERVMEQTLDRRVAPGLQLNVG